jgi:radical SAM protein with 4Fe4S-binding SPASM domain
MQIDCSVLGKDVQITDATIPVLSPYWRLKRSGEWSLLCKYEPEQISYSILSPLMGATLSLMDGRLTFRHLSMVVQYAHDFDSLEKSKEFVVQVIEAANKDNDAVLKMAEQIAPYIQKIDPLQFVNAPPEDAKQRRPASPLSLNLMFSNKCETNCMYCYAHGRNVPPSRQLSTERWMEIFHEAHSLGIEQVSLSGGDPLFRKDALTLIAELIKLKMLFLLSTKCHVTREKADRLVDIGMNMPVNQYTREIQLSMDGPDEKTADVLAGSPGYFHRAIDSVRNLVARDFNLRVKAVVTPLNAPRVYEWIKLLADFGVNKLSVAAYNRTFYRHDDSLFLSKADRALIAEQCRRARADFPDIELRMSGLEAAPAQEKPTLPTTTDKFEIAAEPRNHTKDKAERWKDRAYCSGGRSSMTITPDGRVVLCDTIPQEAIFVVGDVTTQSIMDVWNSDELLKFAYPPRDRFASSACYDCSERTECQSKAGYCFRDTFFNYGTVYGPPPKCPLAPDDGMRME